MDLSDLFDTDNPSKNGRTASALPGREADDDSIDWGDTGAIDMVLQGRTLEGAASLSMQSLTEASRKKGALKLPIAAGTRVTFVANLGSVLAYDDIPADALEGTVVTVRSADGDVTSYQDNVHVLWDDEKFRAISAEHLRLVGSVQKVGSVMRVSSFGDLSDFFEPVFQGKTANSDLVHKATKDLWSFRQDGDEYVIERLFTFDGAPLKV